MEIQNHRKIIITLEADQTWQGQDKRTLIIKLEEDEDISTVYDALCLGIDELNRFREEKKQKDEIKMMPEGI